MAGIRDRLRRLAGAWLLCQVTALGVVSLALSHEPVSAQQVCDCPGELSGAMCPMHHGSDDSSGAGAQTDRECVLRSGCAQPAVALLSIFTLAGTLPTSVVIAYQPAAVSVSIPNTTLTARTGVPDLPPPRA